MKYKIVKEYYPFAVSKSGKVKNVITGNVLCTRLDKKGYETVSTSCKIAYGDYSKVSAKVHRLVAIAYIPNPCNLPQVNHINGVKSDNRICNLEWVTQSENIRHALRTGLKPYRSPNHLEAEDAWNATFSNETIHSICKELVDGARDIDIVNKYNTYGMFPYNLRNGVTWTSITSQYNLPKTKRGALSEGTVRWVCKQIAEGYTNKEILKMCTNPSLKAQHLSDCRNKKCYKKISEEYF